MKFGVVVFPGSNCDHDAYHAAKDVLGQDAEFIWHKDTEPEGRRRRDPAGRVRARRLPAHRRHRAVLADHAGRPRVRARAAARCSASATASRSCSRRACCPGAMLRNRDLKFHCEHVIVRVEQTDTPFTRARHAGPACCGCRSRTARATTTRRPRSSASSKPTRRVIFRYCDARGEVTDAANPNGSVNNIAGICNEARNVVGLMPHPERACEAPLGSADGLVLFESRRRRALAHERQRCARMSRSTQPCSTATA